MQLVADQPSDALDGLDLAGAMDTAGAAPLDSFADDQATMAQGIDDGETLYDTAVQTVPTEAWLNQPPAFDPTGDPGVNLNYGDGATTAGPGGPPNVPAEGSGFNMLVTSPLYQFTLFNVTQYNANYFKIGDHFKLTIIGPPRAQIHVQTWHDGQNLGDVVMGQTDDIGKFELTGVMGPDQVGAWLEEWYGNDVAIQSVAFFVIQSD